LDQPIDRYAAIPPPSSDRPVLAETNPLSPSRHGLCDRDQAVSLPSCGVASLIAAGCGVMLMGNQTASAEQTSPALSARDESTAKPFAAFVAEAAERFDVPAP